MEELIYWLATKKLPKIGDVTYLTYLKEYEDVKKVFELYKLTNFNKTDALKEAELEYKKCQELNIEILTYSNKNYPEKLKEIHSPPPILYCLGDISILNRENIVAVVGSRNPTDYGINATKDIVKGLVRKNIIIASGFAKGIDTIAHQEALYNNGKTIAVLGSGINIIYPAKNRALFDKIKNNGLIISEFSLDTKPEPGNFPKRNRIISGISKSIVVIEAGKKSGSLITAEFGLNQGRDIYALPGNIYNYKAKGTNYLIKNGAYLLESANDILENSFPYILEKEKNNIKEKIEFKSEQERVVYDLLSKNSYNFDELVRVTFLSPQDLMAVLTSLEIEGVIKKINGKIHIVKFYS